MYLASASDAELWPLRAASLKAEAESHTPDSLHDSTYITSSLTG